jgi:hypothetical protein
MTEPSELQKSVVNEASYLRGCIITSYAQVEFLLADISVKLDLKFPYLLKKRIKAVLRIAERPGYEIYREELQAVCDELLKYDELRNFMAHGFLIVTTDLKDNHLLEYQMYQRADEHFQHIMIQTNLEKLEAAANDVTRYVDRAVRLFSRIYIEKKLEA